ncbi:MAG: hypothetical protein ABIQ52_12075 [Vicinamibacterales bacterium]
MPARPGISAAVGVYQIAVIAFVSCYVPAQPATRVDPWPGRETRRPPPASSRRSHTADLELHRKAPGLQDIPPYIIPALQAGGWG